MEDTAENLEKAAMAKLYNDLMPDEIEPSRESEIEDDINDIDLRIAIFIKNEKEIEKDILIDTKDISSTPGEIEVYKDDSWVWEGFFNANVLGEFKKGKILDYPEIIASKELSNIEKIDILDKLIYEKQIELLSIKDYIINQILVTLINKFLSNPTIDKWNQIGFNKIIDFDKISLEDEESVYNHFKTMFEVFSYNQKIDEIIEVININNINKIITPIEASFDLLFSVFECLIGEERVYFVLKDNNEFKEWN
jgi:hypothetical protein